MHFNPSPFDTISAEIAELKQVVTQAVIQHRPAPEIIDRKELERRLGVTQATVIRYVRRKEIPEIRIGASCRYNWPDVVEALKKTRLRA